MLPGPMLLINFPLILDSKVQYGNLALGEALTIPLGIGLWRLALRLRRGTGARRLGGAVLLLVAALYSLAWLGLNGLVAGSALGLV